MPLPIPVPSRVRIEAEPAACQRALQPWSIVTGTPRERAARRAGEERDDLGDLGRLDQPLDRLWREDHPLEHLLLGHAVDPRLVGDLLLDQRRAHVAGQTAVAVMPSAAPSSASTLTSPSTPCLPEM